jgi:hypothetical protein
MSEPINVAFRRLAIARLLDSGLDLDEARELFDANDIEDDMTPEQHADYLVLGFRGQEP